MSVYFTKDRKCIFCGEPVSLSERYDAEYCTKCNIWLISKCSDPNCEFCSNRPENPNTNVV